MYFAMYLGRTPVDACGMTQHMDSMECYTFVVEQKCRWAERIGAIALAPEILPVCPDAPWTWRTVRLG